MLPADGGGGYSGTPWYAYEVPDMWAMLKDQQTDNHWKQVSGWKKTYELTSTHLFRLKEYRDNLIAAWSPEKSQAAKVYVERLDYLIKNVQETYDAAIDNYTTSSGAISALSTARYELQQVYNDYAAKQKAKSSAASSMPSVPSSEMPGGQTPTPSPSAQAPPVNQAELDRLNNKARGIMSKLGGELSQAQVQIKPPPEYKPAPPTTRTPNEDRDAYGGGGGSAPPTIPPIMAASPGGSSSPSHGATPGPMQIVPAPTAPGNGPILGGVGTLPPPAPPSMIPGPPNVLPPTPPPGSGILPPMPPGMMPTPPYGGGSINPLSSTLIKPGGGGFAGVPRAMPPGGMIGGAPGAGLGQPGAAGAAARRINPVGGVIGGNGTGSGTTPMGGQRGGGTGRSPMMPGGRAGGGREDESGQRWDPDNPWETDEGVAPVVLPPREARRIDPGPAIGFDR